MIFAELCDLASLREALAAKCHAKSLRRKKTQKKAMKILQFTFKNEAKWMVIFSLALPAIGFLILLALLLMRRF